MLMVINCMWYIDKECFNVIFIIFGIRFVKIMFVWNMVLICD